MPRWPFACRISARGAVVTPPAAPRAADEPAIALPAVDEGDALTGAHVCAVYEHLLGRTPTPDEVDHQLVNARTLGALLEAVLASDERRLRAPAEVPRPPARVVNVYTEELARWGHAPGTWSEDGVAVVGRGGWVFLGGGSNAILDQHRGLARPPEGWAEQWREALDVRRRDAQELGTRFAAVVVPDKLPVLAPHFPEALPEGVDPPARRLARDLGVAWPVEELRRVPGGAYLRTDTHLTFDGNAALARLLGTGIGVAVKSPADISTRPYVTSGDLGARFDPQIVEVVRAPSDFGRAEVVESNRQQLAALGGHVGTRQVLHNEQAPDPRTAVVFGDSYAFAAPHYQGITWFMGQTFRCVHFVWSPFGWDPEYVARCGATVALCEGAERFAIRPPAVRVDAMALAGQTLARLRAAARAEAVPEG